MAEDRAPGRGRVVFVLKGYPRLSETFIAQEIRGLERRGIAIDIVALRRPTDSRRHEVHDEIRAPVAYLPEYLHDAPRRVWRAWRRARLLPGYAAARAAWRRDLARDPTRNRVRRFGQACVLAAELAPGAARLHAHFLHTPASVARYAATMLGLPWSASAHAKDIWTTPDWELAEKLAAADWAVTCTAAGKARLDALAPPDRPVALVYHGLDLARFAPPPPRADTVARGAPDAPLTLLSVGRAVPKKGYDVLLLALARLPAAPSWRFVHIGGGGERPRLERRAEALGLADRVDWRGAADQAAVLAAYRAAGLFVLASRVADDGDRDGLPNVLMEAMSQELPCVSTAVSAIPELIADGETGLLVPPDAPEALAAALARAMADADLRRRLGAAGADRVRRHFSAEAGLDDLARRFRPGAG
jgi:glycosyltransferase involved in cell wall biosynthesis